MALPDLLRRRMLVAAAAAGLLVGAAVGLFLPIRAATQPKSDEAPWSLPGAQDAKRFREDQFQLVRNARFWGDLQKAGQRGAQPVQSWTMNAIVTRPRVRVSFGVNGKAQEAGWVGIGEAFPDGATLVAVNRDAIWYEKDGCRRVRKLYQKPADQSDACIDAAGAPVATPAQSPARLPTTGSPSPSPARKVH